jgi:ParB family chromosome partitioning protein
MSRESVANSLRILTLPDYIKKALRDEKIAEGHARALLSIKETDIQKKVFEEILTNNYTVRDVESISKGEKPKNKKSKAKVVNFENKDFFERKMRNIFSYDNLEVNKKQEKIQLVVNFDSENDLRNWMRGFNSK